jgi:F420-dependent oxidoreductase-like protein
MKFGMQIDYAGGFAESAAKVAEFEKAGLDIAWVAEAYGFDAPTFMGYLAAKTESITIGAGILPIYTRTPTLMAMTAASMDTLTNGRFILGLGASGPQVIEGFHGVKYDAPLGRTREIIDICRLVWKRERVTYNGKYYTLPLPADQGTGLGKPLKMIAKPIREDIPVWIASLGPKNVAMTAEIADGWLPIFYMPERAQDVWGADLAAGAAKRDPILDLLRFVLAALSRLVTTCLRSPRWHARWLRSTQAAWEPRVAISITISCAVTDTKKKPPRSRTSTLRVRRMKRLHSFRQSS